MKSIFIVFDQAYYEQILLILNYNHVRGFTRLNYRDWETINKIGRAHV